MTRKHRGGAGREYPADGPEPDREGPGLQGVSRSFLLAHERLAARLGLARSTITNLVALLDLPPELQNAVRVGQLTTGHAKILKGITDPERQLQLSKEIISRGLSVHATEAFVKQQAADKQAAESEANGATEEEAGGKTVVERPTTSWASRTSCGRSWASAWKSR